MRRRFGLCFFDVAREQKAQSLGDLDVSKRGRLSLRTVVYSYRLHCSRLHQDA